MCNGYAYIFASCKMKLKYSACGSSAAPLGDFFAAMKGARKMSRQKLSQQVMWTILITLLFVGCGAPAATPTPIPPTATPTPTSEPLPGSVAEGIEVTFDGNDCTVTGPTELPAGEHTFIFIDQSDMRGELSLVYLEDGKTFQDLLDEQIGPGVWSPKQSWVIYDTRVSIEFQESNGRRVDSSTWKLDKVGEHTIICYVSTPQMIWVAAPFMVVETPSE